MSRTCPKGSDPVLLYALSDRAWVQENAMKKLLCAAALILGMNAASAAAANLKVSSFPSGAQVVVDGVDTNKITPMSVSVTEGDHSVTVQIASPGWAPQTRTVTIASGNNDLSVTLLPLVSAGPPGAQGATGPQGPKGDTGATGAQGSPGVKGDTGPTGMKGDSGPIGPEGPAGPRTSVLPAVYYKDGPVTFLQNNNTFVEVLRIDHGLPDNKSFLLQGTVAIVQGVCQLRRLPDNFILELILATPGEIGFFITPGEIGLQSLPSFFQLRFDTTSGNIGVSVVCKPFLAAEHQAAARARLTFTEVETIPLP
jgi:hypothetical protein